MDDYNINTLSEARGEYSSRLVSIITPPIIQGFRSIFDEAYKLCVDNEEETKYLMTFQNFLTRVPKWNQEIINLETTRITETSKCNYLEDLLTCVHITQLKILTSIRVSNKQKKIDIDIPKLHDFIHKVYIMAARKIYQNVYLFEKDILPLQLQKHMRECELLIKESILTVIRETMPIEKILRSYMDETEEEELIEENVVKEETKEEIKEKTKEEIKEKTKEETKEEIKEEIKEKSKEETKELVADNIIKIPTDNVILQPIQVPKFSLDKGPVSPTLPISVIPVAPTPSISFNDTDNVISFTDKDAPDNIQNAVKTKINAPKTVERLEQLSTERYNQRKSEEEDDDDLGKIKIMDNTTDIKLDSLDVQVLDNLKLNVKPELLGVEVLD